MLLVCAILWTALSWTSSVRADVRDAKPGDYLEVRFDNEWRKCKVLSITRTGRQIRVRVEGTGQTLNYTSDRFRELPADKPKDGDAAPTGDFRIWIDITGKFRIEAKFVAIENNAVKLVRKDGTSLNVPLAKLSEADREFAKNVKTNMKADDDNPFKVDDSPPSPMPKSAVDDAPPPRTTGSATSLTPGGRVEVEIPSTVTPTDASRARDVIPTRPSKPSYEPDPVEARQLSDGAIGLPKKKDRHYSKITNFSLDQASLIAALSRNALHGPSKGFCEIDLLDLGSATLLNTIAFSANANARDVIAQPDTIRFVTTSGDQKRVDVWERSETGLTHLKGWIPFKDKKVDFVGFADSDHLLTIGDGKLVGWTCQSAKPTYSMKIKSSPPPTFSPGRKYLVAGHDLGLAILDAASGKLVTVLDDNGPATNTVRFSPDGMRLATLTTFRQLRIWNLADGTKFPCRHDSRPGSLGQRKTIYW